MALTYADTVDKIKKTADDSGFTKKYFFKVILKFYTLYLFCYKDGRCK